MIYLLDKLERLVHIVPETALSDFVYQVELNVFDEASFELPADYALETWSQVAYFGFFYRESFLVFRIVENNLDDRRFVKGRDRAESDLRTVSIIKDKRPHEVTADQAVRVALEGSGYAVGKAEGLTQLLSTSFYYISPLEALVKVVDKWGCEFRTRYTFVDNRVVGRYIDLYKRQGKPSGRQFVYGDDLLSVVYEESSDDVVTALIGRGKGEELDSGGYGRRIEFSSVAWSQASGDPITKPVGQNYITNEQARENLGLSQDGVMKHRWGVFVDDQIEDPEKLLRRTYEELVRLSVPVTVFKANILALGSQVWLGDTVAIIRDELKLVFEARIQKLVIDMLAFEQSEVVLGDYQTVKNSHRQAENRRQQARIDEGLSAFGQAFQQQLEMIEAEKERKNREIDEAIRKTQLDFDHYIIQAEQKAQETVASISAQIDAEIKPLASQAKTLAEEAKRDLQAKARELGAVREDLGQLDHTVRQQLGPAFLDAAGQWQAASAKADDALAELARVRQNLSSQATAQTALLERLNTVENTSHGTRLTMTELSKGVDALTKQTSQVSSGLSGLEVSLEAMRLGRMNLLRGTRELRLTDFEKGTWDNEAFVSSKAERIEVADSPVTGLTWGLRLRGPSASFGQRMVGGVIAGDYTLSCWVKGQSGTVMTLITVNGNAKINTKEIPLKTDGWEYISFTTKGINSPYLMVGASLQLEGEVLAMAPMLNQGAEAQPWADYGVDGSQKLSQELYRLGDKVWQNEATMFNKLGDLGYDMSDMRQKIERAKGDFRSELNQTRSTMAGQDEKLRQQGLLLEAQAGQLQGVLQRQEAFSRAEETLTQRTGAIEVGLSGLSAQFEANRLTQEDLSSRVASYKQSADESLARLGMTTENLEGTLRRLENSQQTTAQGFETRLSELISYKNGENSRATRYLEASRAETAKQLRAMRTEVTEGYVAKSSYDEDVRGINQRFEELTEGLGAQTERKLATFKTTIDGRFDEVSRKLGDKMSTTAFRQEADKIKQSVSSLEKNAVRASDITINEQGIRLSASKTIGANALSSILAASPESIQAITNKMVITPHQLNLITPSKQELIVREGLKTWVSPYYQPPLKNGDEFFFEGRADHAFSNVLKNPSAMAKGGGSWTSGTFRHSGPGTSQTVTVTDSPVAGLSKAIALTGNGAGICQDGYNLTTGTWEISWWVKAPSRGRVKIQAYWNPDNKETGVFQDIPVSEGWQKLTFTAHNQVAGNQAIAYIYYQGEGTCLVMAPQLSKVEPLRLICEVVSPDGETKNLYQKIYQEGSLAKGTLKVSGLTKPVKQYRFGLWLYANGWTVREASLYRKQSAQLIVDGSITGRQLMAESIEGGHIKAGTLTGDLLKVGTVTADKLLVDEGLFEKLTAGDALVNKLIAKEAFVNALSAVTFDFTKASGDYIQSKSGAMKWDLVANKLTFDKSARIEFKDFGNAVVLEGKGKLNGQKTNGGLAFTRVKGTNNVAVVVGTSSGNTFSPNDVTFTGLRALQDGYECGLYGSIIDICDTFDSSGHANWTNSIYINKNKGTITLTSRSFVGLNVGSSCSLTISPQGIVAKKGNYTRTLFS